MVCQDGTGSILLKGYFVRVWTILLESRRHPAHIEIAMPTSFQKRICWAALTALAFVTIGAVSVLIGWLVVQGIGFLRPLLTPLAVAGILTYLLEPVVSLLCRKLNRALAVTTVFVAFFLFIVGLLIWIVPSIYAQGERLAVQLPSISSRAQGKFLDSFNHLRSYSENLVTKKTGDTAEEEADPFTDYLRTSIQEGIVWLQAKLPDMAASVGTFLHRSAGGFFGFFGFVLSLLLVPVFLFFFLKDAPSIAATWSNYLPLRASPLKSEVVSLLLEINSYLVNFFRGQLLVSLIDGALVGFFLILIGLDFAVLIGLLVGVLGLIPYLGVFICWIPAVIIATAQFGDWWHPIWVTVIFLAVNNLDGMIIAPKIVGESVGLHPLTVILSVLGWSIVLGGLLGALLAVPLTATIKVVLRRYFWDRPGSLVKVVASDSSDTSRPAEA